MYGKILKSLTIVKLYRGMSKLKVEINVNLPQFDHEQLLQNTRPQLRDINLLLPLSRSHDINQ